MLQIRPHQLFALLDQPPADRVACVQIPAHRAAGGLTLLETFLLVATLRIVGARRVFEFGTYRGSTTLNLALNTPDDGEVVTLDLDNAEGVAQLAPDAALTEVHVSAASRLDFSGSDVARKIKRLHGNSLTFDLSEWFGSVDLAFVDGGHDIDTVTADTNNAFKLIRPSGPSAILWHDFSNPEYPDLTDFLETQALRREIFHIGDTMLCAWLSDSLKSPHTR